jgi:CheY-like chemotaxis protein
MPDTTPIRILYAEDAQFLREYVSKQLRASGYAVVDAPSGDEAFAALLGGADADILLTDINMPGSLDGWTLAQRSRDLRPRLAVIYASSERQDPDKQVADSRFVSKPYEFHDLLAVIQSIAMGRRDDGETPSVRDIAPLRQPVVPQH